MTSLVPVPTMRPDAAGYSARGYPKEVGACPPEFDFGFVELTARAERMTGSRDGETVLELYDQWLLHHPTDRWRHFALYNYGSLLSTVGRSAEAATALVEAARLAPAFLPAYVNAGVALERVGRREEAIGYWTHVADHPVPIDGEGIAQVTAALRLLAHAFEATGRVERAEETLRRCIEIDPHQRDFVAHWVILRAMQCKWPVIAPWGKVTRPVLMQALSPLAAAIHTNDPMFQLASTACGSGKDRICPAAQRTIGRWPAPEPGLGLRRPLRIGYVSPDLREHAVGSLTAELFELHDRSVVEVFAYYSGPPRPDALQARIRHSVDHWRDIFAWSDTKAARHFVRDEIDILVDLGGHTNHSPTAAFALRPAPVIVNWLGYPGSMGTAHHQYIVADDTIIPRSHEKYYSERVVRLPCYQPTDRKRIVAAPMSRLEAGLADGAIVYCCFNGTQKITPAMFRCWMAILARVPGAVLWLLSCDVATDERLRRQAACHGVSPDRLVFAVRKPNAEHLARYQLADLFLDTAPYGAHTTASDALWMGVPILTMIGHGFASRVCASLVHAAGLGELVCDGAKAYVDHAVELGTRPEMLSALRGRLREGRDRCTLFDMPLLTARLEALYVAMWDDYLSDRIPEPDLTNLGIYSEIGCTFEHEVGEDANLEAYERTYATALAYRNAVSPIPPDCRLWPGDRTQRLSSDCPCPAHFQARSWPSLTITA